MAVRAVEVAMVRAQVEVIAISVGYDVQRPTNLGNGCKIFKGHNTQHSGHMGRNSQN